ncbi:MAG: toll/interleukin-1 receptor domain-containing protein [Planctomycetes bacterium]|nr:toll/interleukin-1 receptor domain-containing protein [Planctomycetota bacterium]
MDKSGIVNETPVTLSTAAGPDLASAQVFVSYRVGDDVELAEALKALIADSVTPQPEVFVSSKGGLKPSRLGLKPQLQKAVQGSSIVVGVITGNSVDRDWVIFEAGAAWGLGAPYAPVLHDVTAEEMPSVYGDNYAHRSTDRNEMLSLVRAVADLTGGRVRGQFSTRYRKYRDVVVNYVRSKNPTRAMTFLSEADYETSEDSYFLFAQGREDEAQKQIEQRVNDTQENDEKARILSEQLIYQQAKSNIEKVKILESWPQELRETYAYIYWRAVFEPDKSLALSMIDDAIKKSVKTVDERAALLHKLQLLSLLSRHDEAREVFRGIVESSDIEQVQMAVRHFRTESTTPDGRMILDVFGYKVCRADEFRQGICGYAIDNKLPGIAMWAASNDFLGGADGAKHLALGQAYIGCRA